MKTGPCVTNPTSTETDETRFVTGYDGSTVKIESSITHSFSTEIKESSSVMHHVGVVSPDVGKIQGKTFLTDISKIFFIIHYVFINKIFSKVNNLISCIIIVIHIYSN